MMVTQRKIYNFSWARHKLEFGRRTCVMGVVNITPDSFSDGGKFFNTEAAIAQGARLAAAGADIIDIGGESTRPFSDDVCAEDEIQRVVPVIEKLAERLSVPISIDTTKAAVAKQALQAGASIINDVSALRFDSKLAEVAALNGTPVILMHMLGNPETMQVSPSYGNLIADIHGFLEDAIKRAEEQGIHKSRIIIDPGIGFGKSIAHNLLLIKHVQAFASLDTPILIGPSRKTFIRKILKSDDVEDIQPDLPVVETGTQAAVAAAVLNGAHMVRVHDVAYTVATVKIVDAVLNARNET